MKIEPLVPLLLCFPEFDLAVASSYRGDISSEIWQLMLSAPSQPTGGCPMDRERLLWPRGMV